MSESVDAAARSVKSSANDVARFCSALCEKNDWLPKSPIHPNDPVQSLEGEESGHST